MFRLYLAFILSLQICSVYLILYFILINKYGKWILDLLACWCVYIYIYRKVGDRRIGLVSTDTPVLAILVL